MTKTIDSATAIPGPESPTRSESSSPAVDESTTVGRATALPAPRLPTWFAAGLVGAVVWCATAGATGIVLLTTGGYHPVVVGAVATLAALAAAVATARALGPRADADHRAGIAALGLVIVFFALAGAFHSEHLLTDRDPALYITSGRSIARTHQLTPKFPPGPFNDASFGNAGKHYGSSFFPMLPVLLAMGWSIGGELGLLLVGPVLGALGLLACYAFATRVLGTRRGLFALMVLIAVPLQLWFARDAYSELLVQVVVLAGLWLYLEARVARRWGLAAVAGTLIASSALARIDALAIMVGVLGLVAVEWSRSDADVAPVTARRVVAAFVTALVAGAVVALLLTHKLAAGYLDTLRDEYRPLLAGFVATTLAVVVVIVAWRIRPGLGRWIATRRHLFAIAVTAASAVFVWAFVLRPEPHHELPVVTRFPITLEVRNAVDDWHYSRSLHWLSGYIGVVGIVVAFVGFVVLADRARRGHRAATAVFLVAAPVALLYLARPSVAPDQPWAMRRFLPVVLPGLAIAITVAFVTLWRASRTLRERRTRVVAGAGVAAALLLVAVPTASAMLPLARARIQHGAVAAVNDICRLSGDDGAVLVYGHAYLDVELPQPVRAFCGVPVGASSTADLADLARQWHDLGRRLLVATAAPDAVTHLVPGATIIGHDVVTDDHDPEKSFDRAPKHAAPVRVEIWILEIPVGSVESG